MRTERGAFSPFAVLGLGLVLLGAPRALAAQAPLFLVNRETRIGSLEFTFPEGRTLTMERVRGETALRDPGTWAGIQSKLDWLPFVSEPGPVRFDPVELQKDRVRLTRFYADMGFPRAEVAWEVQLDTTDNAVDVRFSVVEGPPMILDTARLEVVGLGAAQGGASDPNPLAQELDRVWLDGVRGAVGRRFGTPERQALRARALQWALQRGFPFASVTDELQVDTAASQATLLVNLETGPRARVDSIHFQGNQALSRGTLARELPFREGDWYSSAEVNEGQRQIFGLDLVRLALSEVPADQPMDSTVTVRYRVDEGRARLITGEGGYSSVAGMRALAEWSHRDFFGRARVLTASLESRTGWLALEGNPDQRYGASVSLRQPYVFDRRISASITPFVEFRDGAADRSWSYGARAGMVWEKGPLTAASLDYRLSRREVLEIRAGGEDLVGQDFIDALAALDSLESGAASSVLSLSTVHGNVNDPLDPRRGWILRTASEVAGPAALSAVEYLRGQVDLAGFVPLGGQKGLSLRAGVGRLHAFGVSAPTAESDTLAQLIRLRDAMLTAGGTQSVRGWGSGLLGPKVPNFRLVEQGDSVGLVADNYVPFAGFARVSTSAELRLPMPFTESDNRTFLFLDGARVWNPDERFGGGQPDPTGQEDFFWSTGAGLQLQTLAGALRVSVGYKLNPSLLDLRDAGQVAQALIQGRPISDVPEENIRRFHLHLSIGRGF